MLDTPYPITNTIPAIRVFLVVAIKGVLQFGQDVILLIVTFFILKFLLHLGQVLIKLNKYNTT